MADTIIFCACCGLEPVPDPSDLCTDCNASLADQDDRREAADEPTTTAEDRALSRAYAAPWSY